MLTFYVESVVVKDVVNKKNIYENLLLSFLNKFKQVNLQAF